MLSTTEKKTNACRTNVAKPFVVLQGKIIPIQKKRTAEDMTNHAEKKRKMADILLEKTTQKRQIMVTMMTKMIYDHIENEMLTSMGTCYKCKYTDTDLCLYLEECVKKMSDNTTATISIVRGLMSEIAQRLSDEYGFYTQLNNDKFILTILFIHQ
jgi:hypothetical protein